MAYDVARVRGLHPSLGDGWVRFDAQNGMLLPDAVGRAVSTAFRGSMPTPVGPHPSAQRSAAVLDAARQAEERGWRMSEESDAEAVRRLGERGLTIGSIPPEVMAALKQVSATMTEEWVAKAGEDGRKLVDALRAG